MKEEKKKIVSGEQEKQSQSLKKKLDGMVQGLNVYNTLDKDEEDVKIPFTLSLYVTSVRTRQMAQEYLDDLARGECRESLGTGIGLLASADHWLEECAVLRRDMEGWSTATLKEHGYDCTILGFRPRTTTDLYRAIEDNMTATAGLLGQVQRQLRAAPLSLYGHYYRHLRAQYCEAQAVRDFDDWLMHSGIITPDKLKSLQAKAIADFLNSDILQCCIASSDIERSQVDIGAFKRLLPGEYHYDEWFDNAYTIFNRTIGWQGDIVVPNYDCAGLFIFQHCDQLTQEQIHSIFYLDKMLEQIREKMTQILENKDADGVKTISAIRRSIALLMAERQDDEPLFCQQGHWQAVYRILVDKSFCLDSDFDGFDTFIRTVMPDKVNKPYKKESVKQISQTVFALPFHRWHYDPVLSGRRKPYDRMVAIASRFKAILEENLTKCQTPCERTISQGV